MTTLAKQAREYVERVGIDEAKRSNHYLTAVRHCRCGECFCCSVKRAVEQAEKLKPKAA